MAQAKTAITIAVSAALMIGAGTAAAADSSDSKSLLDPQADALLKKMSDYMAGLKSFSADSYVFDEQIMGDGFKMSVLRTGSIKVQRPNKLAISRKGELRDQHAVFDGKQLALYGKTIDAMVTVPVSGDIDAALDASTDAFGSELPARDLLSEDAYTPLMEPVTESAYLGTVDIGGNSCRHLAFRTDEVDWQLWVQEGDVTLPCRYTITSKWLAMAPSYTVSFANWQVDQDFPASDFELTAPADTRKLSVEEFRKVLGAAQ